MYDSLKKLLQQTKQRSDQSIGQIIDYLKQIPHFNKLNHQLGTQYLIALIPFLKPFILRKGLGLINQSDHYVLVQGKLNTEEHTYEGRRSWEMGKLIDLRQNNHLSFVAEDDCVMLRICKSNAKNTALKKLMEMQRQRNRKIKEYGKLIQLPHNQKKQDIIKQSSFMSILGTYDLFELALGSQLKQYSQSAITHESDQKLQNIGYIVSGKVKLTFSKGHKSRRDRSVTWFLCEKDWIGLQEFLWQQSFQSQGEVNSIQASILWMPKDLFASKFNSKTNNDAITKLISLVKTKKNLFDSSLACRNKKLLEMELEKDYSTKMSDKLQEKMVALQDKNVVAHGKKHIKRNRAKSKQEKEDDVAIPEYILHKMKKLEQTPVNLPKMPDKVVFFPQEYANFPIRASQKKEMDRLAKIIKPKSSTSHSTLDLNPQALYKTIYNKISFKYPSSRQTSIIQRTTVRPDHSSNHFNSSIANNFRVNINRQRAHSTLGLTKDTDLSILRPYD